MAYCRPRIPEMLSDVPYHPVKLDVWQPGSDFQSAFDVSRMILSFPHFFPHAPSLQFVIADVKTVIGAMASNDASLRAVVHSLTPQSFPIAPIKMKV